jgi:hypothetical protein
MEGMMKKYTRKIHIQRLRKMIEKPKPCQLCPAGYKYNPGWRLRSMWTDSGLFEVCNICRDFIKYRPIRHTCPCIGLGKEEAMRRTIEALEAESVTKSHRKEG